MTKTQIKKSLESACGGALFITQAQLKRALGVKKNTAVSRYLEGLTAVSGKYFLIDEVAENMWQSAK